MKKKVSIGLSLIVLIYFMFAQSQMSGFTGTTVYKQGMSLEDASHLATVSQSDAISSAQTRLGVLTEPLSVEITVLDGFIVWMVDMDSDIVYVDISNPELTSLDSAVDAMYLSSGDDDGYDDDDHNDDDDHEDYEDGDHHDHSDHDDD